jgi:hypothetical protein
MRKTREILFFLVILPYLVLILITLPIWIPVVAIVNWRSERRIRIAADKFSCLKCGKALGAEAVALADAAHRAEVQEFAKTHHDLLVRRRIVRTLHAICSACGTQYTFLQTTKTFVIREDRGLPEGHSAVTQP